MHLFHTWPSGNTIPLTQNILKIFIKKKFFMYLFVTFRINSYHRWQLCVSIRMRYVRPCVRYGRMTSSMTSQAIAALLLILDSRAFTSKYLSTIQKECNVVFPKISIRSRNICHHMYIVRDITLIAWFFVMKFSLEL